MRHSIPLLRVLIMIYLSQCWRCLCTGIWCTFVHSTTIFALRNVTPSCMLFS